MRTRPTRQQIDGAPSLIDDETPKSVKRFNKLDKVGHKRPLPKPMTRPLPKSQRVILMMRRYARGQQLRHPLDA
jgi:hypothetical protein